MNDAEMAPRKAFVQEAVLQMDAEIDPASIGAAVTVELCGHWEHEGTCRWPHNNGIEMGASHARFRTLFISDPEDEAEVRERITEALSGIEGVSVADSFSRPVGTSEQALAERLLRSGGTSP